jgi:hypothetical protein
MEELGLDTGAQIVAVPMDSVDVQDLYDILDELYTKKDSRLVDVGFGDFSGWCFPEQEAYTVFFIEDGTVGYRLDLSYQGAERLCDQIEAFGFT